LITRDDCQSTGERDVSILYVEDDAGLARLMQKQLERKGSAKVETASDAESGLRMLREHAFDVALIDYLLPQMNGLQLLQMIRAAGLDVPVIILTGAGNEEVAAAVFKAGAFDYLVKGVGDEYVGKVCATIRSALDDRDMKARRRMMFAKQQLAEKVFDITKEGILVTDAENNIEAVNPAFVEITGYSFEEVVGLNPRIFQSGRHDDLFYQRMWDAINTHGTWEGEIWNKKKSGEEFPEWLAISTLVEQGDVARYIGVFTDISERKQDEAKIRHQASHDSLTDLPNRSILEDRANEAMQRAERERTSMAILFIDLDRFKNINDHYGHAAGDELLIEVAQRIASVLRKSDTVVRISGDEFVVLMPKIMHPSDAGLVAEKITTSLSRPYDIADNKMHISASLGIAVYPGDGRDVETLMNHADVAMYKAKENGRNQHVFFDSKMNDEASVRAQVEADLLIALKENQLMMYYQPVIALPDHTITHAEALIRWNHPEKGLIAPNHFIPIAEQCGLIIPLGEWVANEVCRQMEIWQKLHEHHLQVFLNVSPTQLMHANLDKHLVMALEEFSLPSGSIGIEITENVLIDGADKIKLVLDGLKALGLNFLLDDFGTGFSSMRYLRKLPFDGLKIDRAFVSGVDLDHEKAVLVKTMINMAHSLSLTVVAEGVEREEELAFLRENACDFVQGYLLGRPMPAADFLGLLQAGS